MKLIWRYVRPYRRFILAVMVIKLIGTGTDLLLPYVLEHLLDHVIPAASDAWPVIAWGVVMLLLTLLTRVLNITANRMSVRVAKNSTYAIRKDLFHTALNLSGRQMDRVGLPSLISRMTSDTYNVQSFVRMIQTMGIRAPIMLLGGIAITLTMDTGLAMILCAAVLGGWQYLRADAAHRAGNLTKDEQRYERDLAYYQDTLVNSQRGLEEWEQRLKERYADRDNSLVMKLNPANTSKKNTQKCICVKSSGFSSL